jgi:hypothetical protein
MCALWADSPSLLAKEVAARQLEEVSMRLRDKKAPVRKEAAGCLVALFLGLAERWAKGSLPAEVRPAAWMAIPGKLLAAAAMDKVGGAAPRRAGCVAASAVAAAGRCSACAAAAVATRLRRPHVPHVPAPAHAPQP